MIKLFSVIAFLITFAGQFSQLRSKQGFGYKRLALREAVLIDLKYAKMDAIKFVQEKLSRETNYPDFRPGDNIVVSYRIIEGSKERIQDFRGDVLQIRGKGATKTFTVRKMSSGVGVERIFPFSSPNIAEIKVTKRGKVRRARLFYLRDRVGKKARIKERTFVSTKK